jgi:hypothetical protein
MNFAKLAKRASVLKQVLDQSWQEVFTTHLYLLAGAHTIGEEGIPTKLEGTNSRCMSLAAFPPYLVSHLRRLNVPGADTAGQSKEPVKEHVTHPAFADSGSKVKAPVFGTMSSGTTAENTKAIAEENLFQAPDLAKDWEKLKEVPPLPVVEEGLAVPIWLWVVLGIGASVVFGGLAAFMVFQFRSSWRRLDR